MTRVIIALCDKQIICHQRIHAKIVSNYFVTSTFAAFATCRPKVCVLRKLINFNTMTDPVVGTAECRVSKVVISMQKAESFPRFRGIWTNVARALEVNKEKVDALRLKLNLDIAGLGDIADELFSEWAGRVGSGAHLSTLILVLIENGMRDCADAIATDFGLNVDEMILNVTFSSLKIKDQPTGSTKQKISTTSADELSSQNADVLKQDNNGNTSLHRAVADHDEKAVEELVRAGGKVLVNMKNNYGETPLHRIAYEPYSRACFNIIKCLIEAGTDVYAKDFNNCVFILRPLATEKSLSPIELHELAKYILEKKHVRLFNIPGGTNNSTAMHWIAQKIEVEEETLELLCKHGAKFNDIHKDGQSVLACAIMGERGARVISSFIKFGADACFIDPKGKNLLHYVANGGNSKELHEITKILAENGANVAAVDNGGRSVLGFAISGRRGPDYLRYLVELGASLTITNKEGWTLLHYAARIGTLETLKFLLETKEIDVNARTDTGETPLHGAVFRGFNENILGKVRLFILHGADITAETMHGHTALDYAGQECYSEDMKHVLTIMLSRPFAVNE